MHFKQNSVYGCGLFALANTFQDKSIITKTRLIDSKAGNSIGQLNRWLTEDGKEMYLSPFFFSIKGQKLPKWVFSIVPVGKDVFSIPIFIDFQSQKGCLSHFVAAEITSSGDLIVIDSLKDEQYVTTLHQFNIDNFRVFGVWYLQPYNEDSFLIRSIKNNKR
jgi:hypothetical protein